MGCSYSGLYTGGGDHWYYNRTMEGKSIGGRDLHDDDQQHLRNVKEYDGVYSAELFTSRAEQIIRRHQEEKVLKYNRSDDDVCHFIFCRES